MRGAGVVIWLLIAGGVSFGVYWLYNRYFGADLQINGEDVWVTYDDNGNAVYTTADGISMSYAGPPDVWELPDVCYDPSTKKWSDGDTVKSLDDIAQFGWYFNCDGTLIESNVL